MSARRHLVAAPLLACAAWLFSLGPRSAARADPPTQLAPAPAAVEVAIAETAPRGPRTVFRWVSPDGGARRVAELEHPTDASVKGAVAPTTGALYAVVDADDARDRSFASALYRLDEGAPPAVLARGVAHAASPVVTDDGAVLVERGAKGVESLDAAGKLAQRVDDLEVAEIDPATGASRPLLTWAGYSLHVAGALGRDALVYRIGPQGAALVSVDRRTRALRVLADVGPLARDFSVDHAAGAVVFSVRRRDGTARLVRLDLATGATTELAVTRRDPVPFTLAGGGVTWTDDAATVVSAGAGPSFSLPRGAFLRVKAGGGGWLAALVMPPGALPEPVLVPAGAGAPVPLPAAAGARVEILGLRAGGAK